MTKGSGPTTVPSRPNDPRDPGRSNGAHKPAGSSGAHKLAGANGAYKLRGRPYGVPYGVPYTDPHASARRLEERVWLLWAAKPDQVEQTTKLFLGEISCRVVRKPFSHDLAAVLVSKAGKYRIAVAGDIEHPAHRFMLTLHSIGHIVLGHIQPDVPLAWCEPRNRADVPNELLGAEAQADAWAEAAVYAHDGTPGAALAQLQSVLCNALGRLAAERPLKLTEELGRP